jgi:Ser/Thr protein kinase RdoA (MazF antagonist)
MSEVTRPFDERLVAAWRGVLGAPGTQTIYKMAFGTVWSITTASGQRFVLKRLADADLAKRRHRFTEETRIVVHLGQHGVPVAVPILSDDGRICIEHDGALWALTPMLPMPEATGLPTAESLLQENAGYRTAVGRAIADMHVALADCPYDIDRGVIGPDEFAQRWDRLRAELPEATFDALRRRVDPRWEQIAAAFACADPQRLHGDCHGGNILFRDGRVTGIVDIDHLQVGPRVYDLAYHLAFHVHWVVRTDIPVGPAVASVSSATRLLINGYQAVSALSEAEQAAIAAIALDVALSLVAFWSAIGNVPEEAIWVRTACWIADHEETLHPDGGGVRR